MSKSTPTCPYCGQPAQFFENSACVYSRNYGPIWRCVPCKAWVGCHRGTRVPLGRLADKELRCAKIAAHDHFDKIWKRGDMTRHEAYAWLAKELGIRKGECHIGYFDLNMCQRVAEVCRQRVRRIVETQEVGP